MNVNGRFPISIRKTYVNKIFCVWKGLETLSGNIIITSSCKPLTSPRHGTTKRDLCSKRSPVFRRLFVVVNGTRIAGENGWDNHSAGGERKKKKKTEILRSVNRPDGSTDGNKRMVDRSTFCRKNKNV